MSVLPSAPDADGLWPLDARLVAVLRRRHLPIAAADIADATGVAIGTVAARLRALVPLGLVAAAGRDALDGAELWRAGG